MKDPISPFRRVTLTAHTSPILCGLRSGVAGPTCATQSPHRNTIDPTHTTWNTINQSRTHLYISPSWNMTSNSPHLSPRRLHKLQSATSLTSLARKDCIITGRRHEPIPLVAAFRGCMRLPGGLCASELERSIATVASQEHFIMIKAPARRRASTTA